MAAALELVDPPGCRNSIEKIKNIMRFSGKRMLLYNPIIALKHVIVMIKHNFNKNKKINFKGII